MALPFREKLCSIASTAWWIGAADDELH